MTSAPLDAWKNIVLSRFPWLAYVGLATDGGLSLRAAAAKLLHLQGDAGDPAAARVGDLVVCLYQNASTGLVFASTSTAAPFTWTPVMSGAGPAPSDAGTPVTITTGSTTTTIA